MCFPQHGYFSMDPREHTKWLWNQAKQSTSTTVNALGGGSSKTVTGAPSTQTRSGALETIPPATTAAQKKQTMLAASMAPNQSSTQGWFG